MDLSLLRQRGETVITTERWRHGTRAFGVSIEPGLFHVHGFGWSYEIEWGADAKGAGWIRRIAMLEELQQGRDVKNR